MNVTARYVCISLALCLLGGLAVAQQPTTLPSGITPPQPTVPELYTLMGQYVRVAYNNDGYATLGYRVANDSVGTEWMLLEVGVTVMPGMKNEVLTRESFSIKLPDGSSVPLATQQEFGAAGYLKALNQRADISSDSLNYFPSKVRHASAMRFFADISKKSGMSYDKIDLSDDRAWVGRLFFKVPGGIKTGQHWLIVKFAGGPVEVPFRILTKEEDKQLKDSWKELKKELEASLKQ